MEMTPALAKFILGWTNCFRTGYGAVSGMQFRALCQIRTAPERACTLDNFPPRTIKSLLRRGLIESRRDVYVLTVRGYKTYIAFEKRNDPACSVCGVVLGYAGTLCRTCKKTRRRVEYTKQKRSRLAKIMQGVTK